MPPLPKKRVVVIGAGNYGTAMAYVASFQNEVRWYARDAAQAKAINETRRNPRYLTAECEVPASVTATADLKEAFAGGVDIVVLALPAQKCPGWLEENKSFLVEEEESPEAESSSLGKKKKKKKKVLVCSTAKGLYLPTKELMSTAMYLPGIRFAVLSGPSFAAQIVQQHPTAVVVASKHLADAVELQFALSTPRFRVYASQDVVGVELGGALKNVLAIGAGMIQGSGFGINTMAAYVTRAARELQVLCIAMGGDEATVNGLSGVGDLVLSAFGDLSRNRSCGVRLARGETLEDILTAGTTVEGVPTAEVAADFAAKCNLDLPLFNAVHCILKGELTCQQALDKLMTRPLGMERPLL